MKRELAFALAAELESGHHVQADGFLVKMSAGTLIGRCCLGVACWMTPDIQTRQTLGFIAYDDKDSWLPIATIDYFGFYDDHGRRNDGKSLYFSTGPYDSLGGANDAGVPFSVIAAYIRENYEFL